MKKFYILGLLFLCLLVTGCGSNETKVASTLDNFNTVTTSRGLSASDNMATYSQQDYINGAMIAQNENITIEMIIYDNEDSADKVQDNQINSFMNLKSTGASTTKDKGKNYYSYTLISNGYYMVSSRIDNTLIFCKTLLGNKDTVEAILNELGY